jgi:hypothetical protein
MSTSELKWKLLTKKRGSSLKVELRLPAEGGIELGAWLFVPEGADSNGDNDEFNPNH